ncbi:MAG: CHASE2 domain-containing protein [Hyphomicrobiaceae bacterium]|nr:CHASE2 domain-containing protein [Hyphomicrobiaceae bacterium]
MRGTGHGQGGKRGHAGHEDLWRSALHVFTEMTVAGLVLFVLLLLMKAVPVVNIPLKHIERLGQDAGMRVFASADRFGLIRSDIASPQYVYLELDNKGCERLQQRFDATPSQNFSASQVTWIPCGSDDDTSLLLQVAVAAKAVEAGATAVVLDVAPRDDELQFSSSGCTPEDGFYRQALSHEFAKLSGSQPKVIRPYMLDMTGKWFARPDLVREPLHPEIKCAGGPRPPALEPTDPVEGAARLFQYGVPTATQDRDGVVRGGSIPSSMALIPRPKAGTPSNDTALNSLATLAVATARGASASKSGPTTVGPDGHGLPTPADDAHATAKPIVFSIAEPTVSGLVRQNSRYFHVRLSQLLSGTPANPLAPGAIADQLAISDDALKGSIVVIGRSQDINDHHVTPIGTMSGAMVVLNTIRSELEFGDIASHSKSSAATVLGKKLVIIVFAALVFTGGFILLRLATRPFSNSESLGSRIVVALISLVIWPLTGAAILIGVAAGFAGAIVVNPEVVGLDLATPLASVGFELMANALHALTALALAFLAGVKQAAVGLAARIGARP